MSEPAFESSDATQLASALSPRTMYKKMLGVGLVGFIVLSLLGWAVASSQRAPQGDQGYDLLALNQGTAKEVLLRPGQMFQKGDVLVVLDDTAEQTELATARAELEAIALESQAAGIAVALPPSMGGLGGRIVTTGPLQGGPLQSAPMTNVDPKLGTLPPVTGAGEQTVAPSAERDSAGLDAHVAELETKASALRDDQTRVRAQIDELTTSLEEAKRNADAAKVIADQRSKQAEKMRALLKEGVVSQVETSRSEALYASAQGGYESAVRLAEEQKALLDAKGTEATSIGASVKATETEISAAREAAEKIAKAKPAEPATPPPAIRVPVPSVSKPAFVKAEPPPAVPAKVSIDKGAKLEADARIQAAKDRYDRAEAAVQTKRIVANRSGRVVKVLVKVGDTINPGTSLALVRFDEPPADAGGRTGSPGG